MGGEQIIHTAKHQERSWPRQYLTINTAPIFCEVYNPSLSQCKVPTCFKTSTIISVPPKPKVSSLNDYRPVALTSIAMKVFERLVLHYLKTATDSPLNLHDSPKEQIGQWKTSYV